MMLLALNEELADWIWRRVPRRDPYLTWPRPVSGTGPWGRASRQRTSGSHLQLE
jgi:hypothetical protein